MTNYTLPDENRPFDGSMLDTLIVQSVPVKSALTELINKCWYTDELVTVHMQVPANLELYQDYVLANMGESFEVISIESHVLTTTEELLRVIVTEIYQQDLPDDGNYLDLLYHYVDELAETSAELLIQIKNAHELSLDVLCDLAQIVRNHATMVTPHILLWADKESEAAFQSSFGNSEVTVGVIEIPGFAPREIADYLKLVFRKFDLPFPFNKEDVQKIIRQSRGSGFEIDRLVSQAMFPHESEGDEGDLRGGFPVLHAMVAVGLIALVAIVFFFQLDNGSGNPDAEEGNAGTRTIVVDIPSERNNTQAASAVDDTVGQEVGINAPALVAETGEDAVAPDVNRISETNSAVETDEGLAGEATEEDEAVVVAGVDESGHEENSAEVAPVAEAPETPRQSSQPNPVPSVAEVSPATGYAAQLERLLAHPDSNAFVQLYGTYEEANARKFIQDYAIDNKFFYFKTDLNGRNWFVVVYGGFVSERAAINVRDSLTGKLKEGGPWIRGMSNIRSSIKP